MFKNFIDMGGEGPILHFAHANAYPPQAYQSLLNLLKPYYNQKAIRFRPISDKNFSTQQVTNWTIFSEDIKELFEKEQWQDVYGIGHSLGAVSSLIAALNHPNLFKKLVLIEPVILPKNYYLINRLLPISWRKRIIPVAKIALNRRDKWPSKEAAYQHFRKKKVFGGITDIVLREVIEHSTHPTPEGHITLTFPKHWEAQIYATVTNPRYYLKRLNIPFLIVRGNQTDVIKEREWLNIQKLNPRGKYINIEKTGHLLPFEAPELLADLILNFLHEKNG